MAFDKKIWYQENKKKQQVYMRKYRKDNPERMRIISNNYRTTERGRANKLFCSGRERAINKGLEINIDKDWIIEQFKKGCNLTGEKFVFDYKTDYNNHPYSPSLDRINPSKGYTKDNSQIILWCINQAKGEWFGKDLEKIFKLIGGIYETTH